MSGYTLPLLASGGTVVAAVISGFGAAALRRRWDVAAEDLRWQRERDERRRQEVKLTLSLLMSDIGALQFRFQEAARTPRTQEATDRARAAASAYWLRMAEVKMLLDDDSLLEIKDADQRLRNWIDAATERLRTGQKLDDLEFPRVVSIVETGRRLLSESGA